MSSFRVRNDVLQRAAIPIAWIAALTIALYQSIPLLRTPLPTSLLAVTALLLILRPLQREFRSSCQFRTRVLLIGNRPLAQKLMDEIEACPGRGYTIVGVVRDTDHVPPFSPYLMLGTLDDLKMIVRAVKPHRIVLALADRRGRLPANDLLEFQAEGIVVEDVAAAYERVSEKLAIEAVTPGELISSQGMQKTWMLKATQRAVSFIAASLLLAILAPLLALIALAICIDSGRPVLFRQLRLGKRGRPFKLIKFRSMKPLDAPTTQWAQDNLTRITRVGKWLRRLRLDELPQLVNVIRGDMNLVGPRPHPCCNGDLFHESIPYYALRCSVLPGITGWAQTRYCYANNLEQETEKMRYDLYYIKHMSLLMDVQILFDTAVVFISSLISGPRSEQHAHQSILQNEPARLQVTSRSDQSAQVPLLPILQAVNDSEGLSAGQSL